MHLCKHIFESSYVMFRLVCYESCLGVTWSHNPLKSQTENNTLTSTFQLFLFWCLTPLFAVYIFPHACLHFEVTFLIRQILHRTHHRADFGFIVTFKVLQELCQILIWSRMLVTVEAHRQAGGSLRHTPGLSPPSTAFPDSTLRRFDERCGH